MTRAIVSLLAGTLAVTTIATFGTSSATFTARAANPSNQAATLLVQPPSSIGATSATAGAITLSWPASPTVPGTGHTLSYRVFRGPVGGPYTQIGSTSASVLTYGDTPASDGTYRYVVESAVSGTGTFTSVDSTAASAISDRTAPAMSITCGGSACGSGWYAAEVPVTVSATDSGVGMGSLSYQIDGGATTTVSAASASFSVSGDSAGHTVAYYGRDAVSNTSTTATQTVRIDATAPTAATSVQSTQGTKGAPATINLTWTAGTDALSGVQGYVIYWSSAVSGGTCPAISVANYPNSAAVGPVTAATIPPSGTLKGGAQYCAYLVTSDNGGNMSAPSNVTGPTKAN